MRKRNTHVKYRYLHNLMKCSNNVSAIYYFPHLIITAELRHSYIFKERNKEHKRASVKCCCLFVSHLRVPQPFDEKANMYEQTKAMKSPRSQALCSAWAPFSKVFVVSGAPPRPSHVNKRLYDRTTTT